MSDEPRKEQKVKAKALKVKYKSATLEDFIEQYAKDISRTGMWIKTPKPPALGELLKIEIQLRDETPVLKAAGRVVQRREEAEARPDAPPGMGVRFLKVEEGFEVLERIMARKGEGAGPHFESLRPAAPSVAPPPGIDARSGDFFGNGPPAPLPAEQDQTVMRQMNALLGEALRIAKSPSQPPTEAAEGSKPVGSMKSTMVGMGAAEAAEAVKSARAALAQAEAAKAVAAPIAAPVAVHAAPVAEPDVEASTAPSEVPTTEASSEPSGLVPVEVAAVAAVGDDSAQPAAKADIDFVPLASSEPTEAPSALEAAPSSDSPESDAAAAADAVVDRTETSAADAPPSADAASEAAPAVEAPPAEAVAAPVSAKAEKAAEEKSIERLIEEAVEESPSSIRPEAAIATPTAPSRAAAVSEVPARVDAAPKKRSPMVVYAAVGVVLLVGVVAMLMRGNNDVPAEPTPVTEPTPGPAAPTPPIPPREAPTPPVMEQLPTAPPVPAVQPQPQTTAEPEPVAVPAPTAAPEPVAVPAPTAAPEPAPAVVAPPAPVAAPAPAVVSPTVDPAVRRVRPVVRPVQRPPVRPAAAPAPRPVVTAPAPAPAPPPAARPAPAPAPRPAAPSSGAVPPNPFE